MKFIKLQVNNNIATIVLNKDKVNALNQTVIQELHSTLLTLVNDSTINAIIITGQGNFFSFGFDIPEFLSYSKKEFTNFLYQFTDLYTYIFSYSKPILAALNGHTIAGGCMLALACDYRIMVTGKAKISLNEINFGSTVFVGCTEMLRFCVGDKNAAKILYSGSMYSAEEAKILELVDEVTTEEDLIEMANKKTSDLSNKPATAFASIKALLRKPVLDQMLLKEKESIKGFVDIWYSDKTWENLKNIRIF